MHPEKQGHKSKRVDPLWDEIAAGASPNFDTLYEALRGELPLLDALKETPQDPEWHAEGNVHIHSRMTLDALYEILAEERAEISGESRLRLVLASALHDLAKALTTKEAEIKGQMRVIAPHHAERGRSYLASRLLELGFSGERWRSIISLVGFHHDPRRLLRREAHRGAYWRLSRQVDWALLRPLCEADLRGRRCPDQEKLLEELELFSLLWDEEQAALNPDHPAWTGKLGELLTGFPEETQRFIHAQGRREAEEGLVFSPEEVVARSYQYRERFPVLTVTCGPSGSGKSTWIAQERGDALLISLDEIRRELCGDPRDQSKNGQVLQEAKRRLKRALAAKERVVWDGTNLIRDLRLGLLSIGRAYGALTELVVFPRSLARCVAGVKNRERMLPTAVIERQIARWDWPTEDEAHITLYR